MGRIVLGAILGLILASLTGLAWLKWGHPPVAVADPPLPYERQLTHIALHARIARDMPGKPPIPADAANLLAGAEVYRDQCASCHGFHGQPSNVGPHMFPPPPPLWEKHRNGSAVGVSNDPPGATYWKVANGIRLTGMPAFKDALSETQIWQVSVLLANADKPLPPIVLAFVSGQAPAAAPSAPVPHR